MGAVEKNMEFYKQGKMMGLKISRTTAAVLLLGLSVAYAAQGAAALSGFKQTDSTEDVEIHACGIAESGFYVLKNVQPDLRVRINEHPSMCLGDDPAGKTLPVGFLAAGDTLYVETDRGGNLPAAGLAPLKMNQAPLESIDGKKVKSGKAVLFFVEKPGFYGLANTRLKTVAKKEKAVEVLISVEGQTPVLRKSVGAGQTGRFDTEIGWLKSGDIIELESSPEAGSLLLDYDIVHLDQTDIRTQVETAYRSGASSVRIYPGRYYAGDNRPAEIHMAGWSNFDIDASGVRMVLRNPNTRVFEAHSCTNIALRGLVSDYDPLLFTQGTIVGVADNGAYVDVELHEGYPAPNWPQADRGMVHDARTRLRKSFSSDLNTKNITRLDHGRYRIHTGRNFTDHGWAAGDYVSIANQSVGHTYLLDQCAGMKIVDNTLYCTTKEWSITELGCRGTRYEGVSIVPGPRPLTASVDRLRSAHADGIHSKGALVGPCISNCRFEGLGDDAVAIRGNFAVVLGASDSNTLEVAVQDSFATAGERVRVYSGVSGEISTHRIASVSQVKADAHEMQEKISGYYPNYSFGHLYDRVERITMDKPARVAGGDLLSNRDRNGTRFCVRSNVISNTRARGMVIKASDGVIEGNHISHTALPGILIAATANHFLEADMVSNVRIRRNTFDSVNDGLHSPRRPIQAGAVCVLFDGKEFAGHRSIAIEDNRFINVGGVQINLNNVADVVLNRNVFMQSHRYEDRAGETLGVDNHALVYMDQVDGVKLGEGENANVFVDPGPFLNRSNPVATTTRSENTEGTVYEKLLE